MNGKKLLQSFTSCGIKLTLKGENIEASPSLLITEKVKAFIRSNKTLLVAALRNNHSTELVMCNDCINFIADKIGNGSGIGDCSLNIKWTQEVKGRMPLFRYAERHCCNFKRGIKP